MNLIGSLRQRGATIKPEFSPDTVTHVLACSRGVDYGRAIVGTYRWILECLKVGVLLEIDECPLYRPAPKPRAFAEDLVITVTNYHGKSRQLLQEMITNLGATYTSQMTKRNTHLICAMPAGDKYAKAKEWNIRVVNHTWIEDMYTRWEKVPEDSKYEFFPPCLKDIVGKVRIDPASPYWSATTDSEDKENVNGKCDEVETTIEKKEEGAVHEENEEQKTEIDAQDVPQMFTAPSTVEQKRRLIRTESVVFTKKKATNEEKEAFFSSTARLKRKASPTNAPSVSSTPTIKNKRQRTVCAGKRVIFTSFKPTDRLVSALKSREYTVTQDIYEADILVTPSIIRTEKTLIAINRGIPVVHHSWIEALTNEEKDPADFLVRDLETEEKYGFTLLKSLEKARKSQFMKDEKFYVSKNVSPPTHVLRRIVEAAGGQVFPVSEFDGTGFIITCDEDTKEEQVKNLIKRDFSVYDVELILTGVLRQEIGGDEFLIA